MWSFLSSGAFHLVFRAKRVLDAAGVFGNGDFAIDEIEITPAGDRVIGTTPAPLGKQR